MTTFENLASKIENAKALDFGNLLSESIALFKKTWVQGLLLQVFTFIVVLPLFLIVYLPFLGAIFAGQQGQFEDPAAYSALFAGLGIGFFMFFIVAILAIGVVSSALIAAFFRIIKKLDHDQGVVVSDFFYFFKAGRLKKHMVLTLYTFGIAILATMLCYFPLFYVMIPLYYVSIFLAFHEDLDAMSILKLSFKLGHKKWGITFGLFIVSYFGALILAMLTCGIGVFFLISIMYHPVYLVYKHVVGFNEVTEIDRIGAGV
jgi:hypothetical protein